MPDTKTETKPDQKPKREPMRLFISIDASGAIMMRGDAAALSQLQQLCDKAMERLEEGDGSISYPMAKGKGTVPITVVCF